MNDYGASWKDISAIVRERDGNACVKCGLPAGKRVKMPVDHIFPFKFLLALGYSKAEANDVKNLWTLSGACHGQKGPADAAAKKADILTYMAEMRIFCGSNEILVERFASAAKHFHIWVYWLD